MKKIIYGILCCLIAYPVFAQNTVETTFSDNHSADTYVVKKGDTLWSIAKDVYGDANLWSLIYESNASTPDSYFIYPGQKLTVPLLDKMKSLDKQPSDAAQQPAVSEIQDALIPEPVNTKALAGVAGEDELTSEVTTALELLLSSVSKDVSDPVAGNSMAGQSALSQSILPDSLVSRILPVYSLVFVSQENTPVKKKFFVGGGESFLITGDGLSPTGENPETSEASKKVRDVAKIIESNGRLVSMEKYDVGIAYHIKRMLIKDDERYFNFILTNVNENFVGFSVLTEPLDVLRVRIFSDHGYIYLTDKGLQGLPGYFYAVDAEGNQIKIDPNESVIIEKYIKALDLFLDTYKNQLFMQVDPDAEKKLEKIF